MLAEMEGKNNTKLKKQDDADHCQFFVNVAAARSTNELKFWQKLQKQETYDGRIRPKFAVEKDDINTSIKLVAMDNLDLTTMDYRIDFYLLHEWYDERLRHDHNQAIVIDEQFQEKLWLPDTYIVNSKKSNFHQVTVDNRKIKVSANGKIHLSYRLSARAACPLDLKMFPWDEQHCPLVFESYGFSDKDIDYHWSSNSIDGKHSIEKDFSQYILTGIDVHKEKTEYAIGNWSTLTAVFHLKRVSSFFMVQTMGPSMITVLISWMTFLMKPCQHPARIGLGITSILTMEAIQVFMQSSLPKVNYMTILDVYSVVSSLFVYMALAEYAVVLLIDKRVKPVQTKEEKQVKKQLKLSKTKADANDENKKMVYLKFQRVYDCLKNAFSWHCKFNEHSARKVDKVSVRLFPICFVTFNILFWLYITYII